MPGEVRVPVRLEVIQSSINTVKAAMDSLKPNSSGWRELQKILQSMQKEANNLQITMSKPFSTQSQFTQAEKGINKLENALDQARLTMSRIDFSDLKLDTNQQAAFDGFKRQLQDIQNEAKTFKASLKQSLQMSDAWEGIQKLDPNTATHSFDEIVKAVQNKVKSLHKSMQDAQKAFDNFQPKLKSAKFAEQFASNKDNSFKAAMGEDFNKFFSNWNGNQFRFKSGQQNAFYEFIQQNLNLDSSQIEQLKNKSASQLEQVFQSIDMSKILSQARGTISEGKNKQTNLNNANVAYEEAQRTSMALGQSLDQLRMKEDELQQKTNQVNSGLQQFETNTANAARNSTSFSNGVTQANQGLEGMRNQLKQSNAELMKYQRTMSNINSLKMTVTNFMGFNQVLNIVKKGVREAIQHIHELDDVMNGISVVTNMSTGDLWDQIDAYSNMASKYGVSIKGAYEVSRIYYQQGLETADVMTLTNETLKLAKISGLDYATTTDYMTTALRGFKMEMSDAGRVVDVYSNLAAHTAVSSEELAVAMSKTASSMESVGSTFEESSAMIATMVAVTRESATNIGSALKSIAARYGEMKKDPGALKDLEGEALSYNKVDAALQSVGISLKDSQGEFRNMTDVVLELAEVWDQLDSTQQRYIATQFAGNRQQSRFLALVSNKDLLKANLGYAQDSEGTGDVQAEKTLDSITSKLEQAKVAYQEFYTSIGLEDIFKGALDGIREYINYLNRLPKLFGDIPVAAIGMVANLINAFKLVGIGILKGLGKVFDHIIPVDKIATGFAEALDRGGQEGSQRVSQNIENRIRESGQSAGRQAAQQAMAPTTTQTEVTPANATNAGLTALASQITTAEQLKTRIDSIDSSFISKLQEQLSNMNLNDAGASAQIQNFVNNLLTSLGTSGEQIRTLMQSVGNNINIGLVEGILQNAGQGQIVGQQAGYQVAQAVADGAGCHSPSVFTLLTGQNIIKGLVEGISSEQSTAIKSAAETGQSVIDAISKTAKIDDNAFNSLKTQLIDQIRNLNSEVASEAQKQEGIDFLSNLTLDQARGGLGGSVISSFMGQFRESALTQGQALMSQVLNQNGMTETQSKQWQDQYNNAQNFAKMHRMDIAKKHGFVYDENSRALAENRLAQYDQRLQDLDTRRDKLIESELKPINDKAAEERSQLSSKWDTRIANELNPLEEQIKKAKAIEQEYMPQIKAAEAKGKGKKFDKLTAEMNEKLQGQTSATLEQTRDNLKRKLEREKNNELQALDDRYSEEIEREKKFIRPKVDRQIEKERQDLQTERDRIKYSLTPEEDQDQYFTDAEKARIAQDQERIESLKETRRQSKSKLASDQDELKTLIDNAPQETKKAMEEAAAVDAKAEEERKLAEEQAKRERERPYTLNAASQNNYGQIKLDENNIDNGLYIDSPSTAKILEEREKELEEGRQAVIEDQAARDAYLDSHVEGGEQLDMFGDDNSLEIRTELQVPENISEVREKTQQEIDQESPLEQPIEPSSPDIPPKAQENNPPGPLPGGNPPGPSPENNPPSDFIPPELGAYRDTIFDITNMKEGEGFGDVIDASGLDSVLEKLQQAKKITEEEKSELQSLFAQSQGEGGAEYAQKFIKRYNDITGYHAVTDINKDDNPELFDINKLDGVTRANYENPMQQSKYSQITLQQPQTFVASNQPPTVPPQNQQPTVEPQNQQPAITPQDEQPVVQPSQNAPLSNEQIQQNIDKLKELKQLQSEIMAKGGNLGQGNELIQKRSALVNSLASNGVKISNTDISQARIDELIKHQGTLFSPAELLRQNHNQRIAMMQNNAQRHQDSFSQFSNEDEVKSQAQALADRVAQAQKKADRAKKYGLRKKDITAANEELSEAKGKANDFARGLGISVDDLSNAEAVNAALKKTLDIKKEIAALDQASADAENEQYKLDLLEQYKEMREQQEAGDDSEELQGHMDEIANAFSDAGGGTLSNDNLDETIQGQEAAVEQANGAIAQHTQALREQINAQNEATNAGQQGAQAQQQLADAERQAANEARQHRQKMGGLLRGLSSVISMATMFVDKESEEGQRVTGGLTALSGAVGLGGGIAQMFAGDIAGGLSSLVTSVPMLVSGFSELLAPGKSAQERRAEELAATAERLEAAEKASAQKAQESKTRSKSLQDQTDKIKSLQDERFTSREAAAEYQNAVNTLAESFPELISGFDGMGNAIYNAAAAAEALTKAQQAAAEDAYQAATDKLGTTQVKLEQKKNDMKVEQLTVGGKQANGLYNNNFLMAGGYNEYDFKKITKDTKSDTDQNWRNIIYYSRRLDRSNGANQSYSSKLKERAQEQELIQFNNENQMIGGQNLSSMIDLMTQMDSSTSVEQQADILQEMNRLRFRLSEEETDFLNKYVYSLNGNSYAGDGIGIYSARNFEETMNYLNLMYKDVNGGISSYQQELYNSTLNFLEARQRPKGLSFLQNGSALEGALAKYYADEIFEGRMGKDYDRSKDAEEGHTWTDTVEGELYADMDTGVGANLSSFYNDLNEAQVKLMELYLTESDKYSFADLANIEGMSDKLQGDAAKVLENYYQGISENISINLNDMFSQITLPDNHDIKNLAFNKYTDTYLEQEVLGKFLQNYKSLTDAGLSTGAEDYLNAVTNLYRMIEEGIEDSAGNVQTFSTEVRVKMLDLINKYGVGSEEEISHILSAIDQDEDLAPFRDSIVAVLNETHSNVSLALQASISNLQENWKSTMDGLAKAINGVGMDEKQSLIDNASALGVELSDTDFKIEGSKFLLDEDRYLELVGETQASYIATSESYKNRLNKVNEALKNNLEGVDKAEIFNTVGLKYSDYKGDDAAAMEALQEAYTATYTNYLTYKNMVAQIENEATLSLLKAGKFNAILSEYEQEGFSKDQQNQRKFERLIQLASGQKYTQSELLDKNIKTTVKGIQSSYNKLLSDILSKGIENIDWSDYEYITKDLTYKKFGLNSNSSNKQFVEAIGKASGASRQEINSLMVQAIEKDNAQISEEILANLDFIGNDTFSADLKDLQGLADTFDMPIQVLLQYYDEISDTAILSLEQLEQLIRDNTIYKDYDISKIKNLHETIQESLDATFSSLTDTISNGIKGNVDIKGIHDIQSFLSQQGLKTELSYHKTKDGYKLSTQSAEQLYQILKDIDNISAQIVLDELNESIDRSLANAKDLSGTLKDIAAIRAGTESEQFKFMEGSIPSGQNNPMNYFANWQKAFETINAATKNKNLIDYTDFYNIITEMGNLASATNPIKLGGEQILTNCQDAADLIEQAAGALTVAADGSIKVDLSSIGIDFAASAEGMKTSVNAGIKDVAESQVEMLDGMIQLLETVVAMQELGDIDLGENGVFDLSDIFVDGIIDSTAQFEPKWVEAKDALITRADHNKELKASLEQFKVNGHSLYEILKMSTEELTNAGISFQQYGDLMTSLVMMAQSGDYDLNNLIGSVKEMLAGTNFEGTISLDDNTELVFKQGVSYKVIYDQDGTVKEYEFDGHTFDSPDKAFAAAKIGYVEDLGNATKTYEQDTGAAIYHLKSGQTMRIAYEQNAELGEVYHVTFANGEQAYARSKAELNAAIRTHAALRNEDLNSDPSVANESEQEILQFSMVLDGNLIVNYKINKTTGKIDIVDNSTDAEEELNNTLKRKKIEVDGNQTIRTADKQKLIDAAQQGASVVEGENGGENDVIEWDVNLKHDAADAEIQRMREALSVPVDVPIKPKVSDGKTELQIEFEKTRSIAHQGISSDLKLNTTDANQKIKAVQDDASALSATTYTMPVAEDGNQLGVEIENTQAKADTLSKNQYMMNIKPDGNKVGEALDSDQEKAKAINETTFILNEPIDNLKAVLDNRLNAAKELQGILNNLTIGKVTQEKGTPLVDESQSAREQAIQNASISNASKDYIVERFNQINELMASSEEEYNKYYQEWWALHDQLPEQSKVSNSDTNKELDKSSQSLNKTSEANQKTANNLNNSAQQQIQAASAEEHAASTGQQAAQALVTAATNLVSAAQNLTDVEISVNTSTNELEDSSKSSSKSHRKKGQKRGLRNYNATGNFAMSQGTLMGELGPELVVSNGHYFVAGQNGAEFVDLDPDAIVFNHLQTESLFKNGMSKTRGKAVTNERVATSFAKGNVNGGPAQASASQALSALKQLRNQWKALMNLDPSQMAGAGGGGGGGGDPKAFLKDLEKWYNWLQQIAQLEKEITYEETKRSKIQSDMIAHGQDYHKSQMETLKYLQQQLVVHQSLTDSQYEYFEKRRKELNEQSAFSALYGFGESGQLYYKEGALAWLSDLSGRNATTGEANYTAEEQYKRLVDAGFEFAMKYDSSGNEIKQEGEDWYSTALQAFWDKMDSDKEEMQSLHDSVEEHRNAVLESQASINEIIRDIEDNQINVEQKVLKAIEDSRQREIDEFQKERDAIEKSSKALIDGLSEQLNLEKEMYSNQQEADEFGKLQRQLAILQRSGGSASQITDLQRQISEKQQNMYFDAQQQQIDALQKASDNQLERLDHQIELMTEQLEYEKENGLLWNQVYEVLQGSPESISEFIKANTTEYWGQSPTELTKTIREDLFEIQRFKELQETLDGGLDILTTLYGDEVAKKKAEKEKKEAEEKAKIEGNFAASTAGGSGGGNNSSPTKNKKWHIQGVAQEFNTEKQANDYLMGLIVNARDRVLRNPQDSQANTELNKWNKLKPYQYDIGGMVESTGPALLHAKESVLTASQTATLRNDILSNKPTSLLSLLTDFRDAYNNISNATNSVIGPSDGGIIIENATVEMNVSQIANDYDAQRAGEQALDRMVQIARKSQGWNRIGG